MLFFVCRLNRIPNTLVVGPLRCFFVALDKA